MNAELLNALVPLPGGDVDTQACLEAVPALARLAKTPQDPVYHAEGDVWTHTVMVMDALVQSADYATATDEQRFVLFVSALLHDIAKPDTTVIDPVSGRIGQPGHSRRGSVDARLLLWRAGVPFHLREQVCRIIAVHQLPFFALGGNRSGQRPEFILHKLSWELPVWMLCAVAEADMRGRTYVGKADVLADIELFRELAAEEGCLHGPRGFADDHTRMQYFRGANVQPDYAVHEPPGSAVTVLSGLPASGKNTWVAQHCPDLPVVSFDDARTELGLKHGENEGAATQFALEKARSFLRRHEPFVWNATHLSAQMRKKTLDLLFAYHAKVRLVYLEQPEREIYRRNGRRDTSLRNADIERMLFKWEVPLPTEAHAVAYHV